MNFNDYVLEAAEVNDISMMDVELTQTLAEMAVLEAMMDCYEKQMVLLEYNEDSADEIFTEAETFLPEMENWVVEFKKAQIGREGKKYIVEVIDGKWVNGSWVPNRIGEQNRKRIGTYDTEEEAKNALNKENERLNKAQNKNFGDARRHEEKAARKAAKDERDAVRRRKWELKQKFGKNPDQQDDGQHGSSAMPDGLGSGKGVDVAEPTPPKKDEPAGEVNDQWNGDATVSGPSKSFSNSFKKFMSKAGTAIQQLVLGLVDAIFEVNFEKLKEKVLDKGVDFEVKINKNEFDKLHRLTALIEVTNGYYEECSLDKLKNVTWTKAKVGAYVNTVKELEKALRDKFELVGAENENDEGYAMNKDDFAELCDKLGHGEFKKKLRKCQKEVSAANIDYNVENQIPPVVGKELRKFVNYLIKAYQDTSKCFTKVLKFAEEVGAKAMERSKNGGADYGPAKNAKRLEQRQKMLGKINDMGDFSGKVNNRIAAARAQQAVPAWAEEGWSMNLEEDEDFF